MISNGNSLMHDQAKERDPRRLEAWRAAAAAFRKHYNDGHDGAHKAAKAAVLTIMPELSDGEASDVAIAAVSYASQYHSEWLYAFHVPKPRRR